VTDYRGTEQELWDEEAATQAEDDDRKTLVPAPRTTSSEQSVSQQTSEAAQARPSAPAPADDDQTLVDSVARFIAEAGPLVASPERELYAPRRSLAALELLDAEEGAEASDLHAAPLPPALPANVKPAEPALPLLLGPGKSAGADVTERVTTIPRTHPMANSIAPGGSALSTPPAPRRSLRWQAALGVAALLAIGGASRLLQSRGEHHAASGTGTREGEEDDQLAEARRASAAAHERALAQARARDEAHARALQTERENERLESERLAAASSYGPPAPTPASSEAARVAATVPARGASRAVAPAEPETAAARRVRVGLGGAQLLEREQTAAVAGAGEPPPAPDRVQIAAALSKLTPQLQQCVGDEHGIADVTLTVRAPGVVSHALVEGAYAGSKKGTCIARALRTAKLPPFADPVSRVEYPFQL
jgi:hypothetical protein